MHIGLHLSFNQTPGMPFKSILVDPSVFTISYDWPCLHLLLPVRKSSPHLTSASLVIFAPCSSRTSFLLSSQLFYSCLLQSTSFIRKFFQRKLRIEAEDKLFKGKAGRSRVQWAWDHSVLGALGRRSGMMGSGAGGNPHTSSILVLPRDESFSCTKLENQTLFYWFYWHWFILVY